MGSAGASREAATGCRRVTEGDAGWQLPGTSARARRRSSASGRWSAPGSSRCSARPARSPGAAVWVAFAARRDHRRAPGLLVRASSAPATRRPAACSSTSTGGSARATSRRSPRGSSTPPTPSSRRWSRCRSGATRATASPDDERRRGQGVRGRCVVVAMTALNVAGLDVRRAGPEPRRVRRGRDPRGVRRRHDRATSTRRSSRRPTYPRRPRHRVERRADVLRVPRVRRRDVHGQGPRGPVAPAARGRWRSRSASRPRSTSRSSLGVFGTLTVARGDRRRARRRSRSRPSRSSATPATG